MNSLLADSVEIFYALENGKTGSVLIPSPIQSYAAFSVERRGRSFTCLNARIFVRPPYCFISLALTLSDASQFFRVD